MPTTIMAKPNPVFFPLAKSRFCQVCYIMENKTLLTFSFTVAMSELIEVSDELRLRDDNCDEVDCLGLFHLFLTTGEPGAESSSVSGCNTPSSESLLYKLMI